MSMSSVKTRTRIGSGNGRRSGRAPSSKMGKSSTSSTECKAVGSDVAAVAMAEEIGEADHTCMGRGLAMARTLGRILAHEIGGGGISLVLW
jgi:hypothetical protein